MPHHTEIVEKDGIARITYSDQRFYLANDSKEEQYVPSVTTYLEASPKPRQFYEWLKENGKNSDTMSMEAMEKGSRVHAATETLDKIGRLQIADKETGNSPYYLDEVFMIYRYLDFRKRYCEEPPMAIEQAYGSHVLGEGGTIDRVWQLNDGSLWLFDIKTGNMYDYYCMQLAAYKRLWEQFNPEIKIDKIGILHLNSKTRTEKDWQGKGWQMIEPPEPLDYYLTLFEATKKMWKYAHLKDKPANYEFLTEIIL